MKKHNAMVIDVLSDHPEVRMIEIGSDANDEWKEVRQELNDAFIDTYYFKLPGYDVIFCALVDDCGKLFNLPVSAITEKGNRVALVGNIVITRFNDAGDTMNLSVKDVLHLMQNIYYYKVGNKETPILCNVIH